MGNNLFHKILVADEDAQIIRSIKQILTKSNGEGTRIFTTQSANAAIAIAWRRKPNVIIVNAMLPDLSGWEVLGILRKNEPTRLIPFIMIGDKVNSAEAEIKALNLGADDYINKPLKPGIFRARVEAVIRRCLNANDKTELKETLKSGRIEINMATHTVFVRGRVINLTPKEFALLHLFVKKQNRVLNRMYLSGTIWEREYFQTSHTIDRHIANLRKKLRSEGKRIETLHAIGYKFSG